MILTRSYDLTWDRFLYFYISKDNFQNRKCFSLVTSFERKHPVYSFLWKRYFDSHIYTQSARKISHGDLSTGKSVRPGMEMAECNGTRYAWRLSTAKYHAEFHVSLSSKLQSSSRMRGVACKSGRRKAATFSLLVTSLLCYVTAFVRAWTEAGIIWHRQ